MRAKKVFEEVEFERGKDPKAAMGIGLKHVITLPSGRDMEGIFSTKDEAEALNATLSDEIDQASWELDDEGIHDDDQMDALDAIVDGFVPDFNKLGYYYIDD